MSTNRRSAVTHTPIPHRTKSSKPMAYYTLSEDGTQIKVSRAECLARIDEPGNPYPQHWFVDEESGLVVRLLRNAKGVEIARENMRSIWREQKHLERRYECLLKDTVKCDGWKTAEDGTRKCDYCQRKNVSRTVGLDMCFSHDDDGEESDAHFEPADDYDMVSVVEDNAVLNVLRTALAVLTEEERHLITELIVNGKTERQLAPELGLKEPKSVNKRKHRILEILRKNEALRSFFD